MTCPHCRENFLKIVNYIRGEFGIDVGRTFRDKYIMDIRRGKWKLEREGKSLVVYCINHDLSFDGLKENVFCSYCLSPREKKEYFNSKPRYNGLIRAYYTLRGQNVAPADIFPILEGRFHYKTSTITRIVRSNVIGKGAKSGKFEV